MTDLQDVAPVLYTGNSGGLWPTVAARKVRHAVEACHRFGHLGLITGPSGTGKTTASSIAASMAAADDGADAHYVMMTAAADTTVAALIRVGIALRAHMRQPSGCSELYEALLQREWQRGSLLVIDEAQFLPDGVLHVLRNLWDELDSRGRAPGIVLVGTPDLAERIEGRSGRKFREFEALRGRLGAVVKLEQLGSADFAAIAQQLGIVGEKAGALLERIGRGRGGLHNVRRVEKMARELAGRGTPITLGHLQTAAEVAGVGG